MSTSTTRQSVQFWPGTLKRRQAQGILLNPPTLSQFGLLCEHAPRTGGSDPHLTRMAMGRAVVPWTAGARWSLGRQARWPGAVQSGTVMPV